MTDKFFRHLLDQMIVLCHLLSVFVYRVETLPNHVFNDNDEAVTQQWGDPFCCACLRRNLYSFVKEIGR